MTRTDPRTEELKKLNVSCFVIDILAKDRQGWKDVAGTLTALCGLRHYIYSSLPGCGGGPHLCCHGCWSAVYFPRNEKPVDETIMGDNWQYLSFYFWYRRLVKLLLHLSTGQCELQRICYKARLGALRTGQIEKSLRQSKSQELRELVERADVNIQEALTLIITLKKINRAREGVFVDSMFICLNQICGYTDLCHDVEKIRDVPYSSDDAAHEEKLMQLWNLMMPDTALKERISKQWGDIGFQGKDPQTDFRGMGVLALDNLLYFASKHTAAARKVLSHSHHPHFWFSYAIAGINITFLALEFLNKGILRNHFYNCKQDRPTVVDFHQVYCYLFFEFSSFWISEEPASVMEFNRVRDKFAEKITDLLKKKNTVLELKYKSSCDVGSLSSVSTLGVE